MSGTLTCLLFYLPFPIFPSPTQHIIRMAARIRSRRVELCVGTRKGAFRLTSGLDLRRWTLDGPFVKRAEVNDILLDWRGAPTLYAAATSYWFGTTVQRSSDGGETWTASEDISHPGGRSGIPFRPQRRIRGLNDRESGRSWRPLRQGLPPRPAYLHVLRQAFRTDELDPFGLYLGTSSGAVYASANGGKNWRPIAEHLPEITALHCAIVPMRRDQLHRKDTKTQRGERGLKCCCATIDRTSGRLCGTSFL
jgi:hypothetical protein